ncbi:hypothetical protein [Amycolatopsis sp. lyj-84]|uniref:hypothetical protein n=1 Tax=Amycolatopsis sp. lyj-84 TaxID=2789284 RepID=UPI00397E0DF7
MPQVPNQIPGESYAFEIGTMSLTGSVLDRGDGLCTVRGRFEDAATVNDQGFEIRSVPRQQLADLFRSFADNIAPVHDGVYSFWCDLHVAELEGEPVFVFAEDSETWTVILDRMKCSHANEKQSCRPTWRMGSVALDGGAQ